jgi:hypothetical protein
MADVSGADASAERGRLDDFDSPSPTGTVRIGCSTCRQWGFTPQELVDHILAARTAQSPHF